jgi:glucose-6-phosphate 1-dehydrogenase
MSDPPLSVGDTAVAATVTTDSHGIQPNGALRIADPCSVVFFGASGDLAKRMLFPALYNLYLEKVLPSKFAIVGFSRAQFPHDTFRAHVKDSIDTYSRSGASADPAWSEFARRVTYVGGEFDDAATFLRLKAQLEANDATLGTKGNRLFYLCTPPGVFTKIVHQLDRAGLGPKSNPLGWTRIIVEKPFGSDLESARGLQAEITEVFEEKQIFRIDHYLGKEPVQDIMALRFANMIFEPIWNRRYIDCVQITAAETVGVEGRGSYYEGAGTLRDMIQNHVMNLLALVAMEPPVTASADAIRDEKFKALSALRPISIDAVPKLTARGQYGPGLIDGKPVIGYRQEPSVDPRSNTETYASVKLFLDNWRWADVPFYLRSGKRLARKSSEIAVFFRALPLRLFGEAGDEVRTNVLVLKIQPDEGVSLCFNAKMPGQKMHIRTVTMDFNYGSGFETPSAPAYERLISDAMRGDATLFTRWDAVQLAWQSVMPILERWSTTRAENFPNYLAGSEGPQNADALLVADGREWRKI